MKIDYDLYHISLEDYYKQLEKLFVLKRKLLEKYFETYELENDIPYIDYLLTNKILEIVK